MDCDESISKGKVLTRTELLSAVDWYGFVRSKQDGNGISSSSNVSVGSTSGTRKERKKV